MRRMIKILAVTALACAAAQAAHAEDGAVHVVTPVPFSDGSGATGAVKAECTLDTRLPIFIEESAKGVDVVLGKEPAEGTVLKLEFTNVMGAGGGAWSGAKSVTVRGELYENGELTGSFTATRFSGGGAFGGFKGTCSILGRCIKAIGQDIAMWLRNPTMNARLGDA